MEEFKQGIFYDPGAGHDYAVMALLKYNSKECILVDTVKINRPEEASDEQWLGIVEDHVKRAFHKFEVTQIINNANESNDKAKSKRKRRPNK